jgi:hypothetical protein
VFDGLTGLSAFGLSQAQQQVGLSPFGIGLQDLLQKRLGLSEIARRKGFSGLLELGASRRMITQPLFRRPST